MIQFCLAFIATVIAPGPMVAAASRITTTPSMLMATMAHRRRSTAFVVPTTNERNRIQKNVVKMSAALPSIRSSPTTTTTTTTTLVNKKDKASLSTSPKKQEEKQSDNKSASSSSSSSNIPDAVPKLSDLLRQGKVDYGMEPFSFIDNEDDEQDDKNDISNGKNTKNKNQNDNDSARLINIKKKINQKKSEHKKLPKKKMTTRASSTKPLPHQKPWKASYKSSCITQEKLQSIVETSSNSNSNPISSAVTLLSTLLEEIPSHYCNEVNLLYALSSTVKMISLSSSFSNTPASPKEEERLKELLTSSLKILHNLMQDAQLNERQLCNASWILCKLHLYNSDILPLKEDLQKKEEKKLIYREDGSLISEVWDLKEHDDDEISSNVKMEEENDNLNMDVLLDEIANQLLPKLLLPSSSSKKKKHKFQSCELSMALYSYAILRSKTKPTGWEYDTPITILLQPSTTGNEKEDQQALEQLKEYEEIYEEKEKEEDITFTSWKDFAEKEGDGKDIFYYENGFYDSYLSDSLHANEKEDEYKTFMPDLKDSSFDDDDNSDGHENGVAVDNVYSEVLEMSSTKDVTDQLFDAIARELLLLQEENNSQPSSQELLLMKENKQRKSLALLQTCTWAELTNIAYAYAMRGRFQEHTFSGSLVHEIILEATHRLDHLVATKNHVLPRDVTKMEKRGNKRRSGKGDYHPLPRDVAELAWSIGVMQADNYHFGDAFVSYIDAIGDLFIGGDDDGDNDESQGGRPLQDWNCADLVQLSVSLAHGRIDDRRLLNELYSESLYRLKVEQGEEPSGVIRINGEKEAESHRTKFYAWEISILLWVQASLYLTSKLEEEDGGSMYDDFSDVSTKILLSRIQKLEKGSAKKTTEKSVIQVGLGPQEQANLAWSLTVLERYDTEESMELLRQIFHASASSSNTSNGKNQAQNSKSNIIQLEHAHQLYQAYTILQDDCPYAISTISPSFASFLADRWNVEKARRKSSSARHLTISRTLDLMKVPHVNEHEEDIDVAIVLKGQCNWTSGGSYVENEETVDGRVSGDRQKQKQQKRKVAVEFDGPHHFTRIRPITTKMTTAVPRKTSPRAMGHTVLKYRLLKKKGWTVVRVPFYEFDKIPFWASMERQRYLQRLLKTHANIRFSDIDVSEYKAIVPNRKSRYD